MARRSLRQRIMRATATILLGGSVFQLGQCDPVVRETLLAGLETTTGTLTQTFIAAFFASLADDEDGSLTTTP